MTDAALRFLRTFNALPQSDQHDVLVSLLRLPIEVDCSAPRDDDLVDAADQVFLELEKTEQGQ